MKFVQKKIGTLSVLLLCCYALIACSQLQTPALPMVFSLHDLRVGEGFVDPLGYYEANPRLSWRISESATSQFQTAYQIQVASSIAQLLEKPDLWDSHKVNSTDNAWHKYQGERLTSRQKAVWRVKIWDENDVASHWSEPASFELGLLNNDDWQAVWIRHPETGETTTHGSEGKEYQNKLYRPQYLRREFVAKGEIAQARLYVTAKGVFKPYINGQQVADDVMTPGWTPYAKRIETLTYDVTDLLMAGENVVSASLAEGWYTGRILGHRERDVPPSFMLAQLEIIYANGNKQVVTSDRNWKATHNGPIRMAGNYDGEEYEQALEMPGWNNIQFDDSNWTPVITEEIDGHVALKPKRHSPIRTQMELPSVDVVSDKGGVIIFDMGQNMVGVPHIKIPVIAGQKVKLRFAEALENGEFYQKILRSAKATDYYLPNITGEIEYQPTFTFHGYRYVELSGHDSTKEASLDWIKGVVQHSDFKVYANFESSHPKLNQLQKNVTWGLRGNFFDVPLDCPQRDERLGWTGDAQVFAAPSMYMADVYGFWAAWMQSVREEQMDDGLVPFYVPNRRHFQASSGWGDVATIIPWELYWLTGDKTIVEDNYDMMKRWLDYHASQSQNLISTMLTFADHLQPYPLVEGREGRRGDTDKSLISTAYYARSVEYTAKSARLLGKIDDAEKFERLHEQIKSAFKQHFYAQNLRVKQGVSTQTSYLLPIAFDLFGDQEKSIAKQHLIAAISKAGNHLGTGFLGTPLLAPVLQELGESELMYELLFKETYPSWFYSINNGATTTWERWNSYSVEEGFNKDSMNSLNHYAYGAVAKWFYEGILGITSLEPGFSKIQIEPQFSSKLKHAYGEYSTPQGKVSVRWKIEKQKLTLDIVIPKNTKADVLLPRVDTPTIHIDGTKVTSSEQLKQLHPGSYRIAANINL